MATGRRPTGPHRSTAGTHRAVAPARNPLPLILGAVGGGVLLIVLIALAVGSSGGNKPARTDGPVAAAPPKPPPPPDVSDLEAVGKRKCDEGMKACQSKPALLAAAPKEGKERLRAEIEDGIRALNEGLDAYRKATEKAGKRYDLAAFEKARASALHKWSIDVEKEAEESCNEGMRVIQATESMMTGGALTDEQKRKLREDLEKGIKLLQHGMNLFERSQGLTGHMFDTVAYGKTFKAAKMKLLELK